MDTIYAFFKTPLTGEYGLPLGEKLANLYGGGPLVM